MMMQDGVHVQCVYIAWSVHEIMKFSMAFKVKFSNWPCKVVRYSQHFIMVWLNPHSSLQ